MTYRLRPAFMIALLICFPCLLPVLQGEVVRLEVTSRTPIAGGKSFGVAGPYERIVGRVHFSVALANPHNGAIVDLDKAVNLKDGAVPFVADVVIVQPVDPTRGNGTMILEVPNRGSAFIQGLVDGGDSNPVKNPGDAWLLEHGYAIASLGWQWDVVGEGLRLDAPIARNHGKPITGLVRGDLMPSKVMDVIPLGHYFYSGTIGGSEYAVATPADPRNTLTVRDWAQGKRTVIPRRQWRFARKVEGREVASDRHILLEGGFQPGKLYEYVYVAADPVVAGLGLAALRDFASYAKHAPDSLAPAKRVIGQGISQSGRVLRHLLFEGFNADEQGRIAMDGMLPHVAGPALGSFNHRFAQPSRDGQPTSALFFPVDLPPFSDQPMAVPGLGRKLGLFEHARTHQVMPKLFFSHTSYEYWGRATSLIHTSPDGRADLPVAPEVRIYFYAGLQHFSRAFPPGKTAGEMVAQQPMSPLPIRFFWRAMIQNMDRWLRGEAEPPPSRYPTVAAGTLITPGELRFPAIPGTHVPAHPVQAVRLDFGPQWARGIQTFQPPKTGQPFPIRVPQKDEDGNDLGGIRLPQVQVPLATYLGWNFRSAELGAPEEMVPFLGSFLPFPKTTETALASGDPRKPIAERYASRDAYLASYQAALKRLVVDGYVLADDQEALLQQGRQLWDFLLP